MSETNKIININTLKIACQECKVGHLCLPLNLHAEDLEKLDILIKRKKPLQRSEYIFHAGDLFKSLYVIKSGSAKSFIIDDNGQEQIIHFHLPGDIIGFDAISNNMHPSFAKTLETSSICELPFDELEALAHHLPNLHLKLMKIMSKELTIEQQLTILLGKKSAEEKLAIFLITLSQRYHERGFSALEFHLPMSRGDIANYLGLALETVSRLLTRLQQQNTITVKRKLVTLHDKAQLQKNAHIQKEIEKINFNHLDTN